MSNIEDLERRAAEGDSDAMLDLGLALQRDGKDDLAAIWFKEALIRRNPRLMHDMIRHARESADVDQEEHLWDSLAGVMVPFGQHLWEDGDREILAEWIERCLANSDGMALRMLGEQVRADGQIDFGTRLLRKAAKVGDLVAMLDLGAYARRTGDLQGARDWWQQAANQDSAEAMIYLGRLDEDAGDVEAARAWWEKAAGFNGRIGGDASYLLARSARADGNLEAMKEWYTKAKGQFFVPVMSTQMVTDLVGIAVDAGDVEEARYWFREIERRSTYLNDDEAHAIVNRLAANPAEAIDIFGCELRAIAGDPEHGGGSTGAD